MSLANLKVTNEYQEAIQATEDIESPAVGFAKHLITKEKLIELEEKLGRLKQRVYTIIEKEIQPADLEDSISSLAKRLDNFSISEISSRRPSILNRSSTQTTKLPTQEDQIHGYQAITRGRYRRAPQPARYSVDQHDREILGDDHLDEDEEHFIGICLQDPQTQHIPCDICEPSGKWDYYFRYDAPTNTTPIEEIAATGWGDKFSDNEATLGKVTIIDEKEEWDDDERSRGKILVLQEQFYKTNKTFLMNTCHNGMTNLLFIKNQKRNGKTHSEQSVVRTI
ncbi:hypothetical protein Tco_1106037 [Tanacetum coccineum]